MQFFLCMDKILLCPKILHLSIPLAFRSITEQLQKRCLKMTGFIFFEEDEKKIFLKHHIPYGAPIHLENLEFYSYCIKMIAEEFSSQNFYAKDTMKNYFQIMMHKLEKSRRKGCPRDMCRWSFGYERSRKYGISTDRITTLYRSSSKKHAEICWCKNQERVCQRFENHLSRTV